MKRGLVWVGSGAAVVLAAAWLWRDAGAGKPEAGSGGAAVLAPAPTPAPSFPSAAPDRGGGAGVHPGSDGAGTAAAPAAGGIVLPTPALTFGAEPRRGALTPDEARQDREKRQEEHRKVSDERAAKKKKEVATRTEQRRAEREAYEAARPPDPNRPPPERLQLQLGPAVVPDPSAGKPQ